jgi:hypothetical protein
MSKQLSLEENEEIDIETQQTVRCRNCGFEITSPSFAIEPHEHTFRNPAGYSFHVLCYSDAPGAAELGDLTTEASWFAGHAWSFAICRQCRNHLGWWYSGSKRFAGLIATRLNRK